MIAQIMHIMNLGVETKTIKQGHLFVQTYSLTKGIHKFGKREQDTVYEEMEQLYDRVVFRLVDVVDLTTLERKESIRNSNFPCRETRL